jgi:hypothetical protein
MPLDVTGSAASAAGYRVEISAIASRYFSWGFALFFALSALSLETPYAALHSDAWQALHAASILIAGLCAIGAMIPMYKATSLAERIARARAIASGIADPPSK